MTSVQMGTGVTSIETYTFAGCSALTSMQIGSNVTTINTYAFSNCTSLPVISIPRSVTDIKNQLKEMRDSRLTLVVPRKYIDSFPKDYQSSISDLNGFIGMVRKKQESLPKYYILS